MYHLACPTQDQYEENPIQALESCFVGTKTLLDVALRCNARVVLVQKPTLDQTPREQATRSSWDNRLRRKRRGSTEATDVVGPVAKRRRPKTRSGAPMSASFYY